MARQQYDDIGENYEGVKTLPLARYVEIPGFTGMLGRLGGRSVLDLACGTGFYTRQAKRLGAGDVLGVDISGEMVAAARAIEEREPLGIRYDVLDAGALPEPDRPFDVATAVYLLNYADDEETLARMCHGIHRSLAAGGELLALTQNPDFRFDGPDTAKYGFTYTPCGTTPVGPRVHIEALLDPPVTFDTNYPLRPVYERCLKAAGFDEVTWVPLQVPAPAAHPFGAGFWDDFAANPPLIMVRCRK
ncbi:class I SAM-dependent methyltransferase [Streptomyces albus]|uniref:class I SAM-dependent methyltransferase n=1 Tax=Streptomyces albus TaxID=1888 RepID=UPI0033E3D7EE